MYAHFIHLAAWHRPLSRWSTSRSSTRTVHLRKNVYASGYCSNPNPAPASSCRITSNSSASWRISISLHSSADSKPSDRRLQASMKATSSHSPGGTRTSRVFPPPAPAPPPTIIRWMGPLPSSPRPATTPPLLWAMHRGACSSAIRRNPLRIGCGAGLASSVGPPRIQYLAVS